MTFPARLLLSTCVLLGGLSSAARALDGCPVFTLNLPFNATAPVPAWLGHPATPATTFAALELPVTPPDPDASLLVTVFFQEKNGGFLRVSWSSLPVPAEGAGAVPDPGEAASSCVLSDNFYEGIGMSNQRSLLISPATMKRPGQLVFQCGDSTLGISRIKLEWLQNSTGLTSPAITDILVTPASGKTQPASELAGEPPLAPDAAWHDRIVNVPVTDTPLRIEQGVDFSVEMDGAPTQARLSVKEAGLPWGQHLVVWLNNQRAGVILPTVPELGEAGYPDDKGTTFVGWRAGTFYVPAGILTAGSNTLQFSAEPDVAPASPLDPNAETGPLAVKDVSLQLDYPATLTATATAVPLPTAIPETTRSAPDTTPTPDAQNPALLSLPANISSTSSPNL